MPQASFPPLTGSLPHYHSGRASPERYDNRYERGFSESFGTTLGKHSFALIRRACLGAAIIKSVGIIGAFYLDNQLKGRSPAKLGSRSVLLMGALLLTPCFLALPLAVLPLLLPDLLAFLSLLLPHLLTVLPLLVPDLPAFMALLRLLPPLVLRFVRILLRLLLVGSLISLSWVRSTIHAVLPLVGFARSRSSCFQRGTGATLRPSVRRATQGGRNTSSRYYRSS